MPPVDGGSFRDSPHAAEGAAGAEVDLLDAVLGATAEQQAAEANARSPVERLLSANTTNEALAAFCLATRTDPATLTLRQVCRVLSREVARIDGLVSRQVDAILHHPRFQKLEASWRGLRYMIDQIDHPLVKVRILNVSWNTLVRDLDRSIEFDQSQLFKRVYSEEFGTSGGEPFAVLLGDYEIRPRPRKGNALDDLAALKSISQVAAAAFAPFITSAHPTLLGLDSFGELQRPMNLSAILDQPEFAKWNSLREGEDSRFIGLTLPRVLMRRPYDDKGLRADGFRYAEQVRHSTTSRHLWGNAAYAYGAVLIRSFSHTGWLADIRGVQPGHDDGGLVTGLPTLDYGPDGSGVATRCSAEVMIADHQQDELDKLGFLPLAHCKDTQFSAFYSGASIQKPVAYDTELASENARLSSMLPYMFCASRVAHYFKVLGREKIGSFSEAGDVREFLNRWLQQYVTHDDDAEPEVKARYPLREARVDVREQPGKPGSYFCTVHLRPHYQLDNLNSSVALSTEISPASG